MSAGQLLVTLCIPGRPKVLKNSKRIFGRGRRKIVLPSSAYQKWESQAMVSLLGQLKSKRVVLIDFEVEVHMRFYFANRQSQSDLSNLVEGPADVLQRAGVLADDKLIRELWVRNYFGSEPRTEIEIFRYEEALTNANAAQFVDGAEKLICKEADDRKPNEGEKK